MICRHLQSANTETYGGRVQAIEEVLVLDVGGGDTGVGGDDGNVFRDREDAFTHSHPIPKSAYEQHPPVLVLLESGCRPRQLRSLLSRLMYSSLANPARIVVYHDLYDSVACKRLQRVLASFPVASQTLELSLLTASPALRGRFVADHAYSTWGIAAEEGEGVLLIHSHSASQITADFLASAASVRISRDAPRLLLKNKFLCVRACALRSLPESFALECFVGGTQKGRGGPPCSHPRVSRRPTEHDWPL
jgi:hypothetical protein